VARGRAPPWTTRVGRPDTPHAFNGLARVAHNPGMEHVRALQHVSRYLATATPRTGLLHKELATLAGYYGHSLL
jgi:hypothetical protein